MNNGILELPKTYYSYPIELLGQANIMPMPDDYWHPDAIDWRSRVVSNGGDVTYSTMAAVSKFCRTIDNTGLRDRFYRLNLLCGSNLVSSLVPLYRGPSLSGPQYGNRTDTNINFSSADYNATGNNRGLKSNRNKHLRTGLSPSTIGRDIHISYFASYQNPVHAYGFTIGASTSANTRQTTLVQWVNAGEWQFINGANNGINILRNIVPPPFFLLGSTLSNGSSIFVADSSVATGTLGGQVLTDQDFYIFDENRGGSGTGGFGTDARLTCYTIGRSLNFQQSQMLRSAILTLNSDLNVTIPIVSNADAQSWINRVYFNGGTVSLSTASAVNQFCNEIDAAGLRNKFYRLNLFCGNNLSACLVPLYRGPSLSGTQFGNTIDGNINFISSDYTETGASGGLIGNGTNKYLQTGISSSSWIPANSGSHITVYKTTSANSGVLVSSRLQGADSSLWQIWEFGAGGNGAGGNVGAFVTPGTHDSLLGVTREFGGGSAPVRSFRNTAFSADNSNSSTGNTPSSTTLPFAVFARNSASSDTTSYSANLYTNQRLAAYSIGTHLTNNDVVAYNSIIQAFQTSLGRNV